MNIDDLLKIEKFKELDYFLSSEMKRYAGEKLIEEMNSVFGNYEKSRDWFYSNLIVLGGERPYDYCKKGKTSEIKNILGRIEHGVVN
jgi:uncharacterized protein (DUF2384 family)